MKIFGFVLWIIFIEIPLNIYWFIAYPFHKQSYSKFMYNIDYKDLSIEGLELTIKQMKAECEEKDKRIKELESFEGMELQCPKCKEILKDIKGYFLPSK